MQITTENGYVASYAFIGTLIGGIEVTEPDDKELFEARYTAYKLKDGILEYDEEQHIENERKALLNELRRQRETECFSYINRGQPWYNRLSENQKSELDTWYTDWLNVTKTLTAPNKPSWLY